MNLQECYTILGIPETATGEEIAKAYKAMAMKYHPDRNRDRIEWATTMMSNLNISYTTIMGSRFNDESTLNGQPEEEDIETNHNHREESQRKADAKREREPSFSEEIHRQILIKKFIRNREAAKDYLYRYFQYNLHNFSRRDNPMNRSVFNEIVFSLRKFYHAINALARQTLDPELIEHFNIFTEMIFTFYKASECVNILDSYNNIVEVEAYRFYKKGDESLHTAHKEVFYDRHNRGFFKQDFALAYLMKAEDDFRQTLRNFPDSTWAVETKIKYEYARALRRYLDLFFNE
ncbi:MAG TPA: J domain-containing protein [Spirochaetota bacterium]|nr:J domain-containing protein [Spirochaetota bacterium]HPQ54833.1 J domain-containing protein [Spirochaetota bacterium]